MKFASIILKKNPVLPLEKRTASLQRPACESFKYEEQTVLFKDPVRTAQ